MLRVVSLLLSGDSATYWLQSYASRLSILRISVPQERRREKGAGRSACGNLCRLQGGTPTPPRLLLHFESDGTVHPGPRVVPDGFSSSGNRCLEGSWPNDSPYRFAVRPGNTARP